MTRFFCIIFVLGVLLGAMISVIVEIGSTYSDAMTFTDPADSCPFIPDRYGDLTVPSRVSAQSIDAFLSNTYLEGAGIYFVRAERKHGVNAVFLMSLAILESGWGTSKIFKEKNNPFGFMAYTASPYHSARAFASVDEAIDIVAKYLAEEYFQPEGRWYVGTAMKDINRYYADDVSWHLKIESIAKDFGRSLECNNAG